MFRIVAFAASSMASYRTGNTTHIPLLYQSYWFSFGASHSERGSHPQPPPHAGFALQGVEIPMGRPLPPTAMTWPKSVSPDVQRAEGVQDERNGGEGRRLRAEDTRAEGDW